MGGIMRKSFVTLFLLVALLLASVASVGATSTKVTICHKPGTPAEETKEVNEHAVDGHLGHGDYLGACQPPDDGGDDDGDDDGGDVCEWNESLPADSEECQPPDDGGDDGDDDVCEWDESLPVDSDECQPPDDGGDDDGNDGGNTDNGGNGNSSSVSEPVLPPYIQISVWPDMYQMSEHVVGFAWQVNGTFIYSDLNGNNAEDPGERVVTGTEYRDRVNGFGVMVDDQVLSRLVTGYRQNEVEDLNAFLSQFTAFAVLDDGTFVEVYGWYGINDEWMPLGADGVAQYRPQ